MLDMSQVVAVGEKRVLWHQSCNVALQVGNNDLQHCPICRETNLDERAAAILHCTICKQPVQLMLDGGLWCAHCAIVPPYQDTYLLALEKMKSPA